MSQQVNRASEKALSKVRDTVSGVKSRDMGLCFAAIVFTQPIQTVVRELLRWLLLMANLEFIGIVLGVSLFFYADLAIHSLGLRGKPRRDARDVNGFFLVSLAVMLLSLLIDWTISQPYPILYNNTVLGLLEGILVVLGILMLGIGLIALNQASKAGKFKLRLRATFIWALGFSMYAVVNASIFVLSLGSYDQMETIGRTFLWLIIIMLILTPFVVLFALAKPRFRILLVVSVILQLLPWAFLIIASLLLPHGSVILI